MNAAPIPTDKIAAIASKHEVSYRKAVESGNPALIKNALWRHQRSYAVKVHAARQANRRLSARRQLPDAHMFEIAQQIKWGKPISEPVRLWGKPKASGGVRPIWDFGIIRRAACEAVMPILRAHFHPKAFQYDHRGVQAAAKTISGALQNGYVHATLADITNHYGSFDTEALRKQLPLPGGVFGHVVASQNFHVARRRGRSPDRSLIREARRGIPQGSPIAPIIAQIVTSQLTWKDDPNVVMVNYADNFCVLGKSLHDANCATDTLGAAIAALPGGKFQVKVEGPFDVAHGFDFLGHRFRLASGQLIVRPTPINEYRFDKKLLEYDTEIHKLLATLPKRDPARELLAFELMGDEWVFATSWAAAFGVCTTVPEYLDSVRYVLTDQLKSIGLNFHAIANYKNPDAEWSWDFYES